MEGEKNKEIIKPNFNLSTKELADMLIFTGMGPIQGQSGRKQALVKLRLSPRHTLGYVTYTQWGYEDSVDTKIESEEEGFSYYMTRQTKNMAKMKQKSRIKLKGRVMRKSSGT